MKTYILYDTYETGVDPGEEIGCYNSYEEMRKRQDSGQRTRTANAGCNMLSLANKHAVLSMTQNRSPTSSTPFRGKPPFYLCGSFGRLPQMER